MLRVLDLFSGIGGFSLGLERTGGFETVAFCEIEKFPRKVLRKHWPDVPIYEDVRKLRGEDVGTADVIVGGYPCQPFSTAGRRRGAEDDRHLWPEFSRLVAELRPTWVIGENVAGHISMGLDDVLSDLEGQGYACRTFVIPACAVGAPHRRDRVWTVGHADKNGKPSGTVNAKTSGRQKDACNTNENLEQQSTPLAVNDEAKQHNGGCVWDASDPERGGQQRQGAFGEPKYSAAARNWQTNQPFDAVGWPSEPPICGANDGLPSGLVSARLSALGNAVVPQIPEMIGLAILQAEGIPVPPPAAFSSSTQQATAPGGNPPNVAGGLL